LVKGSAVVLVVAACLVASASASAARPTPACKAGQASSSRCSRTFVAKGCAQFLPLVHKHFGATATVTTQRTRGSGTVSVSCGVGATTSFAFVDRGQTHATFLNVERQQTSSFVGCVASGSTTVTPFAPPKRLSGLGTEAFESYPCPGGSFADVSYDGGAGDPAVPDPGPIVFARVGATDYQGMSQDAAPLIAFLKAFEVKYH
jgi:hypothetical protein